MTVRWLPPPAVLSLGVLAAVLVLPTGAEIARNDDWAYEQTVRAWLDSGTFRYLGWNDPSLVAQAVWGALFALLFGPGFVPLRVSTIVLAWLGTLAFYGLARRCGASRAVGTIAAARILLQPLYIGLAWTFNTDVPYLALSLLATWLLVRALDGTRARNFLWPGLVIAAAYLVRQQGLPLAVAAAGGSVLCWRRSIGARGAESRPEPMGRLAVVALLIVPVASAVGVHLALLRGSEGLASFAGWSNRPVIFDGGGVGRFVEVFPAVVGEGTANLLTASLPLFPLLALIHVRARERGSHRHEFVIWSLAFATAAAAAFWLMRDQPPMQPGWPFQGIALSEFVLFRLPRRAFAWSSELVGRGALTLCSVIVVASLATLVVRVARRAICERSARMATLVLGLAVLQWLPGIMLQAVYVRYALPLLPALILVVVADRPAGRARFITAVVATAVMAGLSAEWNRASLERQEARWSVARELVATGVPPGAISVDFAWQGAHLYQVAVDSLGIRPPYDLESGPPWMPLIYYQYVVREVESELEPAPRRSYRSFLARDARTVGVRPVGAKVPRAAGTLSLPGRRIRPRRRGDSMLCGPRVRRGSTPAPGLGGRHWCIDGRTPP